MQQLRGINYHLLTSHADPLNPGENLKVLWMMVETEKEEEESEKTLRIWAASSLMGHLWALYELTINSLCRFPEWGIETNCLLAIQLHSSVPPDKRKKKEKSEGCDGESPIRLFFKNISLLFRRHRPPYSLYVCTHTHLHTTSQWSDHFKKPDICQNRASLK